MQNSKNTLKSPRWCQSRLVESGFECGAAFLHSLGQTEKSGRPPGMSVLPPIADIARLHAQVRFVPTTEVQSGQPLIEKRLANCTN
jgi:hypothetical protein